MRKLLLSLVVLLFISGIGYSENTRFGRLYFAKDHSNDMFNMLGRDRLYNWEVHISGSYGVYQFLRQNRRHSTWRAAGETIAIGIGYEVFESLVPETRLHRIGGNGFSKWHVSFDAEGVLSALCVNFLCAKKNEARLNKLKTKTGGK